MEETAPMGTGLAGHIHFKVPTEAPRSPSSFQRPTLAPLQTDDFDSSLTMARTIDTTNFARSRTSPHGSQEVTTKDAPGNVTYGYDTRTDTTFFTEVAIAHTVRGAPAGPARRLG